MVESTLLSKVLVLDTSPEFSDDLKKFCEENGLLPLKVQKSNLMSVLTSNIDLGAVMYSESYGDSPEENLAIAKAIHQARRELPIFLRRENHSTLDDLPAATHQYFCAAYMASDMAGLKKLVDEYIFCLVYPNVLVRGIADMTESILVSQFKDMTVQCDAPYVVRDRIIFGEVFSLMPLESAWCRGYMMLQIKEAPIRDSLMRLGLKDDELDFRAVNSFLGEVTNLIWGTFKNRFVGEPSDNQNKVQVPLIVNHQHKYISFGTDNPQLCFHYTLTNQPEGRKFEIYQRLIFNLSWSPEDFKEVIHDIDEFVNSGELEFF